MRKYSKGIIVIILFSSLIFPTLSSLVKAQDDEIPIFTVGAVGPRSIKNWDSTTYVVSTGDYYMNNALETLMTQKDGSAGTLDDLIPVLATSWTLESRPDEVDIAGFHHYSGIKSAEFTLRQGVTFHDGSNWNATVCKWNIDRLMYILGNLDGCISGDTDSNLRNARATWWLLASEWDDFSTPSWNVSKFTLGVYGEYNASADYTASRFPRIANVTITENLASGGKVKVEFNDWLTGLWYLAGLEMISMESYKDYFNKPIYGYGDQPGFPQDNPSVFPGHLIGTGPYIYQNHENDVGTMIRFDNWWNASAYQADGWDTIPEVALRTFAHSAAGYQARSNAMVTGDLDYAYDRSWEPLNYDDMINAPDVNYESLGLEDYGENIILNCINETYLRYWSDIGANLTYFGLPPTFQSSGIANADGTINADGTNRAFRKALSYAFDYDTFIHVGMNDRVVRSGGFLAKTHEFYNASIPLPYRNLAIARQALLDDPIWSLVTADRQLSLANSTTEWRNIASSNPIYNFEFNYDDAHLEALQIMEESLKDIGCGITKTKDEPDTYTKMTTYFTFPYFTCDGFSLKAYYPRINSRAYYSAYFKSSGIVERDLGYEQPISDWPGSSVYGYWDPFHGGSPYPFPGYIFPYVQFANWGFNFNETSDRLLNQMWFQNETGERILFNELTEWAQTFQYPNIWLGNDKKGQAINVQWDYTWYWEVFQFTHATYLGQKARAPISGFPFGITLTFSVVAFLGIAITVRRKKKTM